MKTNTSALVDWPFIAASSTFFTKFQNSLLFDEDLDVFLSQRPSHIHIIHLGLDPLFWGVWRSLPYSDPDSSTNTYKAVAISFGRMGIKGGFWDLVNIVNT